MNADEIARGLSPFQPEKVAIESGKIMIRRIDELLENGETFAIETTLASKLYIRTIEKARSLGYRIIIVFFWLESPELAFERVMNRSREGGHFVAKEVVFRRYYSGLKNLFGKYIALADSALVVDNSNSHPEAIFHKINSHTEKIYNPIKYRELCQKAM